MEPLLSIWQTDECQCERATWDITFLYHLLIHFLTHLIATSLISFHQAFCMQKVTLFFYSVPLQGFFSMHMCESPLETVIKIQHMLLSLTDHGIHALICGSILSLIIEYISTWVHRALSALFPLAEEGIHPHIYIPCSHNSFTSFVDSI